jgi:hypothetical protein
MNTRLVGELIRLRYKLMWARTRSRNGKIALFFVGYLLFVLVAILLAAGGFGAGVASVHSGKAGLVAAIVLASLFVETLFCTLVMGFGLNAVFSDAELRRYPLTGFDRRAARHLTGIVDPFWFLLLALEFGLMAGLYLLGAANFWLGLAAALLLFFTCYLLARIVALVVDRLVAHKTGSAVLLGVVLSLSLLPGTLTPMLRHNRPLLHRVWADVQWLPPFAAARAITGTGWTQIQGFLCLAGWAALLLLLLVTLEQRPVERFETRPAGALRWGDAYERLGGWFGARNAPLVGHWLRFYLRNNRFRVLYLISLPLVAFLISRRNFGGEFVWAGLGIFPLASFMGTSRIAANQFGYTGGGFRRFFLLPTDPAACLRTGSYAALLLASPLILIAAVAWAAFVPGPFDLRVEAMLLASGASGLLFFHGAGLWASLYAPRRGNYFSSMGNDMSLGGNVLVIGSALTALFLPQAIGRWRPGLLAPSNWFIMIVPFALALAFYRFSLEQAGRRLAARREWLLARVEGRG